ncbi:MAG: acylphosphatase [Candidatus Dormibacteria bacterium]
MPDRVRIHATVRGRVQMVGFRDYVSRQAAGLDVTGTVANRSDGTLECVAEGPRADVDRLVELLRRGPRAARVETVDIVEQPVRGDLPHFRVTA